MSSQKFKFAPSVQGKKWSYAWNELKPIHQLKRAWTICPLEMKFKAEDVILSPFK
jgi:hypothetical protein